MSNFSGEVINKDFNERRTNKEVMPMTFIAKILKKIFAIHSPSKEWMNAYKEDSPKNIYHIPCTISCNGDAMIDDEPCIYCDVYRKLKKKNKEEV